MEELVFKSPTGTPVTTSLMVAYRFGKRHKDVLRAIDNVIAQTPENLSKRNFAPGKYINASGKPKHMYIMTKDGFLSTAFGFTGKRSKRTIESTWEYIDAFNKMEETPTSFKEALLLAARQQEQIEAHRQQVLNEKTFVVNEIRWAATII
jgi:Rha family phage regulatory protein